MVDYPFVKNPRENNIGDQLINIQYEYLTTRSEEAWNKMWMLSYELSGKLLTTLCKNKKFGMHKDRFNEVKIEAVCRVLKRFKKNPEYFIRSSFAYELRMAQVQILWGKTKAQQCVELAVTKFSELPISEALIRAKELMENEK